MSIVTDVVLLAPITVDETDAAMVFINAQLPWLRRVDRQSSGTAAIQASIFVGAYSRIPRARILQIIAAAPWEYDDYADVRIAIKEEWDDAFTFHALPSRGDEGRIE